MNKTLAEKVGNLLINIGNNIKAGNSELTEDEAMSVLNIVIKEPISREGVCKVLNISNNKFYELIDKGIIPKGHKRRGFKELVWYKHEIESITI